MPIKDKLRPTRLLSFISIFFANSFAKSEIFIEINRKFFN